MNRQLNRFRPFAASLAVALFSAGAFAQAADDPAQDRPAQTQAAPASGPLVPTPPRPGPRVRAGSKGEIVFYSDEVDMGNVLDTEKPIAEFRFKCIGPGPINLTRIKPDCGCTLARVWRISTDEEGNEVREEIDAARLPENGAFEEGDEGIIEATYDATSRQGAHRRNIRISTDSSKQRNVSVQLAVNVIPLVGSDPRVVTFGNAIEKGSTPSRTIRVFGRTEDFQVTKATLSNLKLNEQIKIEVVEHGKAEFGGEELPYSALQLTLTEGMSPGVISDKMFVRTNDPRRPVFEVQIIGRILGDIRVDPAAIRIGRIQVGGEATQEFRVRSNSGTPFKVKGVSLDTEALSVSAVYKPVDPENPTEWIVNLSASGNAADTRVNTKLKIETDVPLEETVEVRFYGVVQGN
ncbi:MAG: DUF1573 domain-containing protein [Phycisphaerales bacterium]